MFFIYIFKKKLHMFRFIKQNKSIIHISFVINRFETFQAISANYFHNNKKVLANVGAIG